MAPKHIALALLVALIWGATFPVTAFALRDTPPIFFVVVRFVIASAFVLVVPRPAVPWRVLILLGLLLGAGQFGFMFVAMTRGISAGLASLLIHSQAFFTVMIAMVAFREPVRFRQAVALLLALAGFACLVFDRSQAGSLVGMGLILTAALSAAAGNNLLKSLGDADMLGVSVWMSLAVPLPLLALSVFVEADGDVAGLFASMSWVTLAAGVYSALLASVFAFAVWGYLFARYSAAKVVPFFLLVPVFGMGLSMALLGETLSRLQFAGAILIFAGLCLALWPARKRSAA